MLWCKRHACERRTSKTRRTPALTGYELGPAYQRQAGRRDLPAFIAALAAFRRLRPELSERTAHDETRRAVVWASVQHKEWFWRGTGGWVWPRPVRKNDPPKAFRDAARELGCDEDEKAFDRKLKKVSKAKPDHSSGRRRPTRRSDSD
jgi:hypothetical protein